MEIYSARGFDSLPARNQVISTDSQGLSMKIAERGGAYDQATEELRKKFAAEAVLTIVLSGTDGTGFSVSGPDNIKPHLPGLFRSIAKEVEDLLAAEQCALLCPVCSVALAFDPRHPFRNGQPEPGAIAICAHCASFLKLDERWRVLTDEELAEMSDEARMTLSRTRRNIEQRRGH